LKVFVVSATEPQDKDVIWIQPTTEIPSIDETKIKKIIDEKFKEYQKNITFIRSGTTIKSITGNNLNIKVGENKGWDGIQNFKITPTAAVFELTITKSPIDNGSELLKENEVQTVSGVLIIDNTSGIMKTLGKPSRSITMNSSEIEKKVNVFSYFYDGSKLYISKAN